MVDMRIFLQSVCLSLAALSFFLSTAQAVLRAVPRVDKNAVALVTNAPRQVFGPRLIQARNWGADRCGLGKSTGKTGCCHGFFDDLKIENNNQLPTYGSRKACPVNMAGFISFPKPKGAGTDVGTIYDLENADHEVIISTFSTFGSPAFTMAYQTDSRKLKKNQDTYPEGSGWWTRSTSLSNEPPFSKTTADYRKLRMSFGETGKNGTVKKDEMGIDETLYWMTLQIEEIVEFEGDAGNNDGKFSELSRTRNCESRTEDEKKRGLQCVHQIVKLGAQNWKAGKIERPSNLSDTRVSYSVSTAVPTNSQTSVIPEDGVTITMEANGDSDPKTLAASKSDLGVNGQGQRGLFVTPNSTRLTISVKNFKYKGTVSKLALKVFFGTDGAHDRKVLYAEQQSILVSKQGAGRRMGYIQWSQEASVKETKESERKLSNVRPSCYTYKTTVGNGKGDSRQQCGRLSKVLSIRNLAFGQAKAQVVSFPAQATASAYFTLGSKLDGQPLYNPQSVQWNLAVGIGEVPAEAEVSNMFVWILLSIIFTGIVGCAMKRREERKKEKAALLLESNRFTDILEEAFEPEKAVVQESKEEAAKKRKGVEARLSHLQSTSSVEADNVHVHAVEGDLVDNFREWWNDNEKEAMATKVDSPANADENATASTGLLAKKDE